MFARCHFVLVLGHVRMYEQLSTVTGERGDDQLAVVVKKRESDSVSDRRMSQGHVWWPLRLNVSCVKKRLRIWKTDTPFT